MDQFFVGWRGVGGGGCGGGRGAGSGGIVEVRYRNTLAHRKSKTW